MKLIDNWGSVLKRAWSMRLAVASAVFASLEVALPFFTDLVPPRTMACLAAFTAFGAAVSRVFNQQNIPK